MSRPEPLRVSAAVRSAIAASFARKHRAEAGAIVATYVGREHERVQLALLALADGDLGALADVTRLAQIDYRDVLYWQACAGAGKLRSPEARANVDAAFTNHGIVMPKRPR
jgi:Cys-tRNA synthase (O-phospho-L-seryl-tRNA:Cys-tRNA synthase)